MRKRVAFRDDWHMSRTFFPLTKAIFSPASRPIRDQMVLTPLNNRSVRPSTMHRPESILKSLSMPSPDRSPHRVRLLPGPWKHGSIPVFGLVGGIGAGKSAVATRMSEIGAFVIDADKVGHALLNQRPVRDQVLDHFGTAILAPAENAGDPPTIDRRALGTIAFASRNALRELESILHPAMERTFEKAIARTQRRGGVKAIVLDAAILFEAGWNRYCDRIVFVDSPRELRLARLLQTRGWDDATLAKREATLSSLDAKRSVADVVIPNHGDAAALRSAIGGRWNDLLRTPVRGKITRPTKAEATSGVEISSNVAVSETDETPNDEE